MLLKNAGLKHACRQKCMWGFMGTSSCLENNSKLFYLWFKKHLYLILLNICSLYTHYTVQTLSHGLRCVFDIHFFHVWSILIHHSHSRCLNLFISFKGIGDHKSLVVWDNSQEFQTNKHINYITLILHW